MISSSKTTDLLQQLKNIVSRLRSPDGCPWDREQTHISLKPLLIEETAELLDSIDDSDDYGICEELGDILLHIVFHAQIAEEESRFTLNDIIEGINQKLIRRHPHVFGDEIAKTPEDVLVIWQKAKKKEKGKKEESRFSRIPRHLPALQRSEEYQKKAAKVGFDWKDQNDIVEKITEELEELKNALNSGNEVAADEEIGDLLFAVSNLSRFRKRKQSEELLAMSIKKFQQRFNYIERELLKNGKLPEDSTIDEMEELWNRAKIELTNITNNPNQ